MSADQASDTGRPNVFDVDETDFEERVLKRSHELPVVVDFWAEWCGPCKALTPALERAATSRVGKVELAKLDTDANPRLSAAFRIQGIPAVKAFRDGRIASEFTGALPPAQVEQFFDSLVPSEADELAEAGDEESLRRALESDPRHAAARLQLGRMLLQRGETEEALALLDELAGDFAAEGLVARARLAGSNGSLERAFSALDAGDHGAALEALQGALREADDPEERDLIRRVMVGIFTELGADHPLAREHRRRLSAALN
jgi:putative thioredoxin